MRESAALYRPRRPEGTTFYALLEQHLEDDIRVHSERLEPRRGALRRVVQRVGGAFLDCGSFHGHEGFARLRCDTCEAEHLIAFSCPTRNLCPSCQSKRAALFGEFLTRRVLLPVPHRHIVFTVPKALRGLFERDRRLLGILARSAYDATRRIFRRDLPVKKALPGLLQSQLSPEDTAVQHDFAEAVHRPRLSVERSSPMCRMSRFAAGMRTRGYVAFGWQQAQRIMAVPSPGRGSVPVQAAVVIGTSRPEHTTLGQEPAWR